MLQYFLTYTAIVCRTKLKIDLKHLGRQEINGVLSYYPFMFIVFISIICTLIRHVIVMLFQELYNSLGYDSYTFYHLL